MRLQQQWHLMRRLTVINNTVRQQLSMVTSRQPQIVRSYATNNNNSTPNNKTTAAAATMPNLDLSEISKMSEEELRKHFEKHSEKDVDKLEKMLEDIVNAQSQSGQDYRPIMIANILLAALFIVSLLMRQRDELMHDMTKELLVDTRDELGGEVLRLKQSRTELIESMLAADQTICNDKCKVYVRQLRREMEKKDEEHITQIITQSTINLNTKKQRGGESSTTTPTSAAATSTSATAEEQADNKSSRRMI